MSIDSGHKLSQKRRTIMVYISRSLFGFLQSLKGLTNDCLVAAADDRVVRVDSEEVRFDEEDEGRIHFGKDDNHEGGAGSVAVGMKSAMNCS